MTSQVKIYFPDRSYRNILCGQRMTVAEVKRKLLSRMQLPAEHSIQLLHAAIDGSNFRLLFDSEFVQVRDARARTHAHTRARTHARTHPRTHARTHIYTYVFCSGGRAQS